MTQYLIEKLGESGEVLETFVFDTVISHSEQSDLSVTSNPVEDGSRVADHAILEPRTVTFTGVLVDYEAVDAIAFNIGGFQLPVELKAVKQGMGVLNKIRAGNFDFMDISAKDLLKDPRLSIYKDQAINTIRNVAPWLPTSVNAAVGIYSAAASASSLISKLPESVANLVEGAIPGMGKNTASLRIKNKYQQLLAMQRSGAVLRITTNLSTISPMLITSISPNTRKTTCVEVSITAQEFQIVSSQVIQKAPLTGGSAYMQSDKPSGGIGGRKKSGKGDDVDPSGSATDNVFVPDRTPDIGEQLRKTAAEAKYVKEQAGVHFGQALKRARGIVK